MERIGRLARKVLADARRAQNRFRAEGLVAHGTDGDDTPGRRPCNHEQGRDHATARDPDDSPSSGSNFQRSSEAVMPLAARIAL